MIGGVLTFVFKSERSGDNNSALKMRENAAVSIVSHKRNDSSMEMARVTPAFDHDETKDTFTIKYK